MCLSTAWAQWEGAHERMTPMEVFLTGGYPLAVLFFPYLLQTSHLPVAVPSSARLCHLLLGWLWLLLPSALLLAFPGQELECWYNPAVHRSACLSLKFTMYEAVLRQELCPACHPQNPSLP